MSNKNTQFKKGHTPHNKGIYGEKTRRYLAGLPNFCPKHGEHLDWVYYEKNKMCACRLCRNERALAHTKKPSSRLGNVFRYAKRHAEERGREFSITLLDIENLLKKQENKCALSGIEFEDYGNNICSLDRIDSNKGYSKDNIQLVTKSINVMKSNLEIEEFISNCISVALSAAGKSKYGKKKKS